MIRSRSFGSRPAFASASCAALVDMPELVSPSSAMRRSRIPVRETIHSSVVSTICSRSKLVSTLDGTYLPHPVICP